MKDAELERIVQEVAMEYGEGPLLEELAQQYPNPRAWEWALTNARKKNAPRPIAYIRTILANEAAKPPRPPAASSTAQPSQSTDPRPNYWPARPTSELDGLPEEEKLRIIHERVTRTRRAVERIRSRTMGVPGLAGIELTRDQVLYGPGGVPA